MRRPLPEPRGESVREDLITLLTVLAADADDPRARSRREGPGGHRRATHQPMTVDELHDLLAVQDLDTQADQLRHRRAHLPERARLDEVTTELAGVEADAAELRGGEPFVEPAHYRAADGVRPQARSQML